TALQEIPEEKSCPKLTSLAAGISYSCSCKKSSTCHHVLALALYILYLRESINFQEFGIDKVHWKVEMSHCLNGISQRIRTLFHSEKGFDHQGWKDNKEK